MSKLLERTNKHVPDVELNREEATTHERLEVPDDLSGLVDLRDVPKIRRADVRVRWLRWVPVVIGLTAALVAAAVIVSDGGGEDVATEPAIVSEGPGSTSLDGFNGVTRTYGPGPEGPGSTSLAGFVGVTRTYPTVIVSEGPGSTSLDGFNGVTRTYGPGPEGPGSTSLDGFNGVTRTYGS